MNFNQTFSRKMGDDISDAKLSFARRDDNISCLPFIARSICPQSIHKNNKHADQSQLQIESRLISGVICIPLLRQSLIPQSKPSFTSLYSPFNLIFLDGKIMKLPTGEKKSPQFNWADNKSLPIQKHLTDNSQAICTIHNPI